MKKKLIVAYPAPNQLRENSLSGGKNVYPAKIVAYPAGAIVYPAGDRRLSGLKIVYPG